jgi:HAD superfamily hydrolase (TIGR01549 family)
MTVPAMTLKLILFDVDDTLCDYAGARKLRLRHAFNAAFSSGCHAVRINLDAVIAESIAIHPHGTDHFHELLGRYGVESADAIAEAQNWYQTNRFFGLRLFPDAVETLTVSRRDGRSVGLITNGPADVQRAKIELLDLERHVDFVLISGEFGKAKPDPGIFEEGLRLGGVTADEALFIGDSPEFDIAGACAAGIRSIWVNRTGRGWSYSGCRPDQEVTDLASLRTLLSG